jgi:uncharacterized repeat protein (TIGR01451 family)
MKKFILLIFLLLEFYSVAQPTIVANDDYVSVVNVTNTSNGLTYIDLLENDYNAIEATFTILPSSNPFNIYYSNNFIIVPAGTPNGTYTITYQVCEYDNLTYCDTANIIINVFPSNLLALSDSFTISPTNLISPAVILNDTFNGIALLPSEVTLLLNNTDYPSNLFVLNTDGTITASSSLPLGQYSLSYRITLVSNPLDYRVVNVNIIISDYLVHAVDDNLTAYCTLPYPEVFVNKVYGNDNLYGYLPASSTNTIITPVTNGPLSVTAEGKVKLAPNTLVGTYQIVYQICDASNSSVCDTATVTVVVRTMLATYDTFNTLYSNVFNVINNDQINCAPANSSNVIVTPSTNGYLSINSSGIITVDPFAPAGTYNIQYQVCDITNSNNCATATATLLVGYKVINLVAFLDTNANGVLDSGENNIGYGNFKYEKNNDGISQYYFPNGYNQIYETNTATTFDLDFQISSYYNSYYSCTTSYNDVATPSSGSVTYYFPVILTQNYVDLSVHNGIYDFPRPGFTHDEYIGYVNHGTQTIASGTINYTKDNALSIVSVSESAIVSSPTGFTYNFTNLLPNEFRTIHVQLLVPTIPTVSLGQMVTSTTSISIPTGDISPSNNIHSITKPIVGSFDPNDKTESHGGKILHDSFSSNDYLNYTIRFENTGTANAMNIRIEDALDSKLDETSIRMIDSSAPNILKRINNKLTWRFDNINLPPSIANTITGKGYITFQIKPKAGYAVGDIITNTANIYFDFNPAIVTEPCITEFVSTLSNQNFAFNNFSFSPNPVTNSLKITNYSKIDRIEITSVLGQKVYSENTNNLQTEIDMSSVSKGIYFVKVTANGNEKTVKILKE